MLIGMNLTRYLEQRKHLESKGCVAVVAVVTSCYVKTEA